MTDLTAEALAHQLIYPLFRGVDKDYKSRYKKIIWEHFTQRLSYAAGGQSLAVFYERLCRKLPVEPLREDVAGIMAVLNSDQDETVLSILRSELRLIVLHCQLLSQKRKEEYEADQQQNEELSQAARRTKRPDMTLPQSDTQTKLTF